MGRANALDYENQKYGDIAVFRGSQWDVLHAPSSPSFLYHTSGTQTTPVWGAPTFNDSWAPTVTAGSGTITTVSAAGRFLEMGKLLMLSVTITITTNGTGATSILCPLPSGFTAVGSANVLAGRAANVSGKMLQAFVGTGGSTTSLFILNYDNSYPGADGEILLVSGMIEVA